MTPPFADTANQVPPHNPGPGPGAHPVWLVTGPALAASLGAFLLTVTIGSEWTAIQRDMHLSASLSPWIFVAFLLPAIAASGLGVLAGRRWPIAITSPAIVLLIAGSLLTALTPGSGPLLLARALTGFGAGMAWGATAVLVARSAARRVLAPVVGGVMVLALCLGPVTATVLQRMLGWRWPFMLAVPVGLVALLAAAISAIIVLARPGRR